MALVSALVTVSMANASVCSRVEKMSWGMTLLSRMILNLKVLKRFKSTGVEIYFMLSVGLTIGYLSLLSYLVYQDIRKLM